MIALLEGIRKNRNEMLDKTKGVIPTNSFPSIREKINKRDKILVVRITLTY